MFIFLLMAVLSLCCSCGLSLLVMSRGPLVAVCRLLILVASLVGGHRLYMLWKQVALVHRLSSPRYVGSSPTRDRTHTPAWQVDS